MAHSVEIKEELYQDIKDYCKINNLKIIKFVNELLEKQFLIEKYGDAPFMLVKPNEIKEAQENYETIIEGVGGQEKYDKMISDLIFETKEEPIIEEPVIKEPVPETPKQQVIITNEPIIDKPNKRRLKSK